MLIVSQYCQRRAPLLTRLAWVGRHCDGRGVTGDTRAPGQETGPGTGPGTGQGAGKVMNHDQGQGAVEAVRREGGPPLPEQPTTCCMSGCSACVWLDFAEQTVQHYQQLGQTLQFSELVERVNANIQDPSFRAFITMELKAQFVFAKPKPKNLKEKIFGSTGEEQWRRIENNRI